MRGLGADDEYWSSLNEGLLRLQSCSGCGKWNWPAVWRCGECGGWQHQWKDVAISGRIFSWTRSWHDFGGPDELTPPFVSVVVELDADFDGQRAVRLLGVLAQSDDPVAIGQVVHGEVIKVTFKGEKIPVIQWSLTKDQAERAQ